VAAGFARLAPRAMAVVKAGFRFRGRPGFALQQTLFFALSPSGSHGRSVAADGRRWQGMARANSGWRRQAWATGPHRAGFAQTAGELGIASPCGGGISGFQLLPGPPAEGVAAQIPAAVAHRLVDGGEHLGPAQPSSSGSPRRARLRDGAGTRSSLFRGLADRQ